MKLILTALLIVYNLIIISGTAYLVEMHGWSPWWFAYSILLLMSVDLKERP